MLPAPRCASRWAGKSPISGSSTNRRSVAASIRCALTAVWISRSTQLERLADPFVIGCRHVVRSLDRRAPCSPLVRALGASSRDPANREEKEVVRLHGDGFGVAPALPGASWSTSGRRRMFDVFGNGGVQPPHSLHKRALAGNSSARRAPHLAHHAAAVGRICGPPARSDSGGVMSCSTAVRRLFEPDERLRAGQQATSGASSASRIGLSYSSTRISVRTVGDPGRSRRTRVVRGNASTERATRVDGIAVDATPVNQKRNPTPIRASPRTGWSRARYCILTKNRDPSR